MKPDINEQIKYGRMIRTLLLGIFGAITLLLLIMVIVDKLTC